MDGVSKYREEVQGIVAWFDRRAGTHRDRHYALQGALIAAAAMVPAFAGFELRWATVVLSSIVVALAGIARLVRYEELWIRYRATTEALRKECRLYDSHRLDYADAGACDGLFARRIEEILAGEHGRWMRSQRNGKDNNDAAPVVGDG